MAIDYGIRSETGLSDVLSGLLRERGVERYGLFLTSGEGTELPDGTEAMSGYVIDQAGRIFFFWTGWDEQASRPAFRHFQEAAPELDWAEEPEYRLALEAAGVAA